MILGGDCIVHVEYGGALTVSAALGGDISMRAVEVPGTISLRVDAEGRLVGVFVETRVPPDVRIQPRNVHEGLPR